MTDSSPRRLTRGRLVLLLLLGLSLLVIASVVYASQIQPNRPSPYVYNKVRPATTTPEVVAVPVPPPQLNKSEYATRMLNLANNGLASLLSTSTQTIISSTTGSTTTKIIPAVDPMVLFADHKKVWPVTTAYPNVGALLPFSRIVAYYGNFYSTKMGALGEYEPAEMKRRLLQEVERWQTADPKTPVIPAIDYIAMVAQAGAGSDGLYRNIMPDTEIQKAVDIARELNGVVFLELQVGLADLPAQIKILEKWLKMPDVHLAIDPEFRMKNGNRPGTVIGTVDAVDINSAITYLHDLTVANNLPPKILLVHRFTQNMVTNATKITTDPAVQVVMVMDGWGPAANKFGTYYRVVEPEPVQFTGFKVFYKNDLKPPSTVLLSPADILELKPQPIFIQYQ